MELRARAKGRLLVLACTEVAIDCGSMAEMPLSTVEVNNGQPKDWRGLMSRTRVRERTVKAF
jgi:hypothetical protein